MDTSKISSEFDHTAATLGDVAQTLFPKTKEKDGRLYIDLDSIAGENFTAALVAAVEMRRQEVFYTDGNKVYGMTPEKAEEIKNLPMQNGGNWWAPNTSRAEHNGIARAIVSGNRDHLLQFFSSIEE